MFCYSACDKQAKIKISCFPNKINVFIEQTQYLCQNGKNGERNLMIRPGIISASKIAPVLTILHGLLLPPWCVSS